MSGDPGFRLVDSHCSQSMDDDARCGLPSVVAGVGIVEGRGLVLSFACERHAGKMREVKRVLDSEGGAR